MNVCILTVCDPAYKDYIPLFLMSARKAFPEYAVKVFYRGKADEGILKHSSGNEIIDDFYVDYPYNKATTSTMRFCLPDACIEPYGYDYTYTTDIDMIFVPESVPLHEQHLKVMEKTGLCYENFAVPSNRYTYRFPGVHFASKEWWKKTSVPREVYWKYLKDTTSATSYDFDESVLWKIHRDSGLEMVYKGGENWRWHAIHVGRYLPRKGFRKGARMINDTVEINNIRKVLAMEDVMDYMSSINMFKDVLEVWRGAAGRR